MKKKRRWMAFLLCGAMAIGVGASQLIPTIAKPECSCTVEVHGSNCPLSKCTCGQDEHTENCPLYGVAKELTTCICEPEVHAEGCPRYVAEENKSETATEEVSEGESQPPEGAALPEETPAPEEQPSSTPQPNEPEETPVPSEEPAASEKPEQPSATPGESPEEEAKQEQPVSETVLITYRLKEGVEGTLSFDQAEILKGEVIGRNIPEISLSGALEVEGFEISGTAYDTTALAAYEPQEDTEITILTKPVETETLPEGEDGSGYDAQYWETAPSWAGEGHIQGSLLTVAELRELDVQAGEQVNEIKSVLGIQGDVTVKEDEENLDEVLAIYAVTHGQTENFPYGVKITGEQDRDELRSIYWCMTQITGVSNTKGAAIQVKHLDISEGAKVLELSGEQTAQAQGLLSSENKSEIAEMVEDSILNELTDSELAAVMSRIPEDISGERQAVLTAALSLEGKVKYFWGGKSSSVGWNPYWGESYTVTSPGSSQTGTTRTYGMDCSGFVSWAFINAEGSKEAASYIGEGSANQYRNSKAVDWKNAQPGDLVFYKNPAEGGINHVGIVVSVDENGPAAVVHCSSSKNGVVVTDASGFQHVRTPYIYGE